MHSSRLVKIGQRTDRPVSTVLYKLLCGALFIMSSIDRHLYANKTNDKLKKKTQNTTSWLDNEIKILKLFVIKKSIHIIMTNTSIKKGFQDCMFFFYRKKIQGSFILI